jgi:hypothetical protein
MITNATMMPCHDFYDTIKEGVTKALTKLEVQQIIANARKDEAA